jgi:hypothetical protein
MTALFIILGIIALLGVVGVLAPHGGIGGQLSEDIVIFIEEGDIIEGEDPEDQTQPFIRLPFFKSVPPDYQSFDAN